MITVSVGCILINHNGEILLQKRDDKKNIYFPRKWGLFGGACEKDENPELATKREIYEELNIQIGTPSLFLKLDINCDLFSASPRQRIFFYYELKEYEVNCLNLKEGEEARFFLFSSLPALCNLVSFDAAAISLFGLQNLTKEQIIPR